jgi:hypothetical protein
VQTTIFVANGGHEQIRAKALRGPGQRRRGALSAFFMPEKKRADEGRMMNGFKKTFCGVLAAMTLGLSATSVADDALGWHGEGGSQVRFYQTHR